MFMKKRKCINPYVSILVLTMAAIGVVCIVDKGRCMCQEKMNILKEKMPMMFPRENEES